MSYAIISLSGKQYVVKEGESLLVDRLAWEEGKTFQPDVLFLGGNGAGELAPKASVTAKVVAHERGPKIRIGKYKPKSGYKRHTGFRASLTRIEVTGIGGKQTAAKAEVPAAAKAEAPAAPKAPAAAKAEAAAAPKAEAPAAPKAEAAAAPKAEAPAAPKAKAPAHAPKGLPKGYGQLTVAQISEGAKGWNRPMLEAALAYEQEHAKRKGALAALESALAAKEGH